MSQQHTPGLSADEMIFARRMLPHFMTGKSPSQCAEAVIDDDARILSALCDRSYSLYFPTADDRGRSVTTRQGVGDVIASELSRMIYCRLRAISKAEPAQ